MADRRRTSNSGEISPSPGIYPVMPFTLALTWQIAPAWFAALPAVAIGAVKKAPVKSEEPVFKNFLRELFGLWIVLIAAKAHSYSIEAV